MSEGMPIPLLTETVAKKVPTVYFIDDSATMREVFVGGLGNVLKALPAPGRFLHISSTSVYGQLQGEAVDEQAATEPLDESGRIVLEAEGLLIQHLPTAIRLRFAAIYGPGRLLRQAAIQAGEAIACDPNGVSNCG